MSTLIVEGCVDFTDTEKEIRDEEAFDARLKRLQSIKGTLTFREEVLGTSHVCPNCGKEVGENEKVTTLFSTRTGRRQASYCSRDCLDEREIRNRGLRD